MILEILKWVFIAIGFVFSGLIALDLVLKWRLDYLKRKERERIYQEFNKWAEKEMSKAYTGVDVGKPSPSLEIYHFENN